MSWYTEHGYDPDPPDAPEREVAPAPTCRVCKGKGQVNREFKCYRCGGCCYASISMNRLCKLCDGFGVLSALTECTDCDDDIELQRQDARDEREQVQFERAHAPGKV